MIKKLAVLFTAGVVVASLAGCAGKDPNHQSYTNDVESKFTIAAISNPTDVDFTKQQVRVVDAHRVEVFLGGSGSCPPVISRVDVDDDKILMTLDPWDGKACTMDYRPYSQVITHPDLDLNKFSYQLCDTQRQCNELLKNYNNGPQKA